MNKRAMAVLFMTISLAIPFRGVHAALSENAGTRAGAFLRIDPSARSAGLGGAFTSIVGEASCIDANPAGLAAVSCSHLTTTYGGWFADTRYGNIVFARPLGKEAGAGVSLTYLDYGSLVRTTGQDVYGLPVEDGTFSASDMNVAVAYARQFAVGGKMVKTGLALKMIRLIIDSDAAIGYGYDVGVSVPLGAANAGLACRNVGILQKMKHDAESLPQEIAAGISRSFPRGKKQTVLVSIDGISDSENTIRFKAGAEYAINDILFLRGGYRANYDTDWLTAGVGIKYADMRLDYAFAPFRILGDTHRISLTFYFRTKVPAAAK